MNTEKKELIAVGKRLREAREKLGISQGDLALLANFSQNHYGCIERGEFSISLEKLIEISIVLNVETSTLIPSLSELKKICQYEVADRIKQKIEALKALKKSRE